MFNFDPISLNWILNFFFQIGRKYSVFGLSGMLMSLLSCSSIDSLSQVLVQISCMGLLRAIFVGVLISFHKIIWDNLKEKKESIKNKWVNYVFMECNFLNLLECYLKQSSFITMKWKLMHSLCNMHSFFHTWLKSCICLYWARAQTEKSVITTLYRYYHS